MNPYRFSPIRARLAACVATILIAPALSGTTVLTNGSPFYFERDPAPKGRSVNQENGFTIVVPPGAERLVVEWRTAPNTQLELMVRGGLDVGFHAQFPERQTRGHFRTDYSSRPEPNGLARVATDRPTPSICVCRQGVGVLPLPLRKHNRAGLSGSDRPIPCARQDFCGAGLAS